MIRHLLTAAAVAVALTLPQLSVTAAKPGAVPTITDLGTLGGGFSDAFGINNDPNDIQVVGRSTRADGFTHGFFWTASTGMIDLGTLGGNSFAEDINNHGVIAGSSDDAARQRRAVVWTMTDGSWTIRNLGTASGTCCSSAYGVNNGVAGDPSSAVVVGSSAVPSGGSHAVMWRQSGTDWLVEDLGTLPGDVASAAHDVNDGGTVVGISGNTLDVYSAFRWTPSTGMVRLPGLGGETYALAVSNTGDIAGLSTDAAGNRHAVRWLAGSDAIVDLGTLGGCCSEGYGINGLGDIVGVSSIGLRSGTQHAFLSKPGGRITDLGALRGQSAARDLNDFGTVVGGSGKAQLHAAIWKLP
jgi:probable HAF family extracellular repeat protein